jgi:hypothetical protein
MFHSRDPRRHRRVRRRGAGPRRKTQPAALSLVVLGVAGLVTIGPRMAHAVPMDDPDIGGIGFSGPTTGDLSAVYWNPAALGLIHGGQVTFAATGRLTTTTFAPVDPASRATASDFTHPISWPPGPGAFAAVGADVGGDRFSLAFATYMPFADRTTYQNGDSPDLSSRYHRISADLRNLALVPALAVRFAGDLRLGFAPGFLFSTGRVSFAETTCGVSGNPPCSQDPASDARYDIASSPGFQSARFALTLGGGLYYRTRAWEFGASFSSRPFAGTGSNPAGISGPDTQVSRPARDGGGPITCMNGRPDGRGCVYADLSYKLPFTFIAGVTWHPRAGVELSAIGRLLSFPANDVIDIRLSGSSLAADGLPQHIVLYRGYGNVLDTRIRYAQWVGHRLRLGVGLRFENSALPPAAISPGAVDGAKLEPTAMLTLQLWKHVIVGAGYGFTYMFGVASNDSVFDPTAASDCEAAAGDLTPGSSCYKRLNGQARPSAAGTYHSHQHDFSLSLTTQF